MRRRTSEGIRHGLLAAVDLEQYDFSPTADTLMRATEATVRERLPARIALRREAVLEMPHVLVLTDDRENSVTALLERELGSLPKLYDFDLMQGGGHIEGYHVRDERVCAAIADALGALNEKRGNAPLYAVGDGTIRWPRRASAGMPSARAFRRPSARGIRCAMRWWSWSASMTMD